MRKLINYNTLFVSFLFIFLSCETFDLDRTNNPNLLPDGLGNADFILNSIQEDFVRQIEGSADGDLNDNLTKWSGMSRIGSELTRLMNFSNTNYVEAFSDTASNDEWVNAYEGILADIRKLTPIVESNGMTRHLGITQFIEAYVMSAMVDFYGDVPYTEAIQGTLNLNPKSDSGASIYDACLTLLNNAIVNFQIDTSQDLYPELDVFYGNNYINWIKAANTLKLKLYMQRRLVDPTAFQSINEILNSGNFIDDNSQDFQYSWPATSSSRPDSRHPSYGLNYTATGASEYMSNWLMNKMLVNNDPRIRFYFYRQYPCTPGALCNPAGDEQSIQCSVQSAPSHYAGFPFCFLDNGYWGRDHGDDDGIPPDGNLRTVFGVYPAGGSFDDNSFSAVDSNDGGSGNGITPILTAAWVDLLQAEMAMVNSDYTTAKTFLLAALSKHITKVITFASKDSSADLSYVPSALDITNYISSIETAFDAAATTNDKWDVFAEQYFVTVFGNGIESFNFYRRTGFPTTLQPNLNPSPGKFIRSLFYPSNEVNTNSSINQKIDQAQPVFWDNNASGPIAN